MSAQHPEHSRDEEIRIIWTKNQWLYAVVGFLGGVLFCFVVQLSIINWSELAMNSIPEATSMLVAIGVIDRLNRRRDERNAVKQLKEQLLRDARSNANEVAKNAVHQMLEHNWLGADGDSLLVGVNLRNAKLQGANLEEADLRGADLSRADLRGAHLEFADLRGADLLDANLQGAFLDRALLRGANLFGVNLQGAFLDSADLQGADLFGVNLQGADLLDANLQGAHFNQGKYPMKFDETTILPDGEIWTPDTDMTRFTNPKSEDDSKTDTSETP